ncbi:MAG: iron-sulfur cluster assembly accessory protein [Alphaproteobacteria bacterium]
MTILVDDSAVKRIETLRTLQKKNGLMLRITVEGGGCSGFQYKLELTDDIGSGDVEFSDAVVTDEISLSYLDGSVIRFNEELIGSEFVIENPNSSAGCGCGASFAV